MKVSDFDYRLPPDLIAQSPAPKRSDSRLLVLNKKTGTIEHRLFKNIVEYLHAYDCLVINNTKVIRARLLGRKETGAVIEILLLKEIETADKKSIWEALVKPGKKLKEGDRVLFEANHLSAVIGKRLDDGKREVALSSQHNLRDAIKLTGKLPLPPYIKSDIEDMERYQTVYADREGSAAAPTAGLHFTDDILNQLSSIGVNLAKVTLNIGLDTFRPVKVDNVEDHRIHSELINLNEEAAKIINDTKNSGGRVVAVGTTAVRTLESCANSNYVKPYFGDTNIFIYPGYKFKATDVLLTNFHLPKSTLLMLVCTFGGYKNVMNAYAEAIDKKYRFFSFGDAMLVI